jgi:hypothetical protein
MPRPSIAYVDEQPDERDNFFGDAYDSELFEHVHLVAPDPDINVTLAELMELKIEALVTDFNLTDAGPLNYSGADLVARFRDIRKEFPCFIRTSWEEDALRTSSDVNRVYSKNPKDDERAGRTLFHRIALQIEHYEREIADWRQELGELMAIDPAERNAADVERILELDGKLESSVGDDVGLPADVKKSLFDVRDSLLEETERLVADMKRALNENPVDGEA